MGAKGLGSRAIIGSFFHRLAVLDGAHWISALSMLFDSDQESETYKWLGQVPALREWVGGRQAKGFSENGITITNKKYEATLEVLVDEIRRDKTGQVMIRVAELARRTMTHWATLLSTLMINGESAVCYDGQFFFDTDHSEGDSGSQSNDISIDISGLPVNQNGSTTAPSPEEMEQVILQAIQQILGFVDNEGEPMNEGAKEFLVMVPTSLMHPALAATKNPVLTSGKTNTLTQSDFKITVVTNTRLTWTDKISVYNTDGDIKPFIRQEEEGVTVKAIAEGSELEFNEDKHNYGVKAIRNVGYGYWQKACLATMT